MVPKLKVSQKVINRLSTVKAKCIGKLYGILYSDSLLILTLQVNAAEDNQCDLTNHFPAEVDLCGVFEVGDDGGPVGAEVTQLIHDVDVTDTPVYMSCKLDAPHDVVLYFSINDRMERVVFDVVAASEILAEFVHVCVTSRLPMTATLAPTAINESFQSMRKQLIQGQVAFNIPKTNTFIMGSDADNGIVGIAGEPTVGELCEQSSNGEGFVSNKKKKQSQMDALLVTMFKKVTRDVTCDGPKIHSPVLHVEKKSQQNLILTIEIDALSIVHRDAKVAELYPILVESCCRYLRLYQTEILKEINEATPNLSAMETFHFFPEECGHFVTKIYAKGSSEQMLENERKQLHLQLNLPLTKPTFKPVLKYVFKWNTPENPRLINPHEDLAPLGDGEIALVSGKYQYYHYAQDDIDDGGWGCAYRSLQTLASWLLLQGYTERSVPTFNEIQQCLVRIGDKPTTFVGSRQWIGSTEVSMVISTLLGITCKIQHVTSGEEMSAVGGDLFYHFQRQGSPVMIGGGVLAHTILGVDYNRATDDVKFLILDPHYTGVDDVQLIQKKGWCGWKGVDFWSKTSFYNMCLPQIPHCF